LSSEHFLQICQWNLHIVSEQFAQDKECASQFISSQKLQIFKHFRHNFVEHPFTEQFFIVSELQLTHTTNVLLLGQFVHLIEHFLHIIFLHILQKREQFKQIILLHDEHIVRQLEIHIFE